jgi:hypothetical protein
MNSAAGLVKRDVLMVLPFLILFLITITSFGLGISASSATAAVPARSSVKYGLERGRALRPALHRKSAVKELPAAPGLTQ